MTASCKLSNPITIVLTLSNGPFRPSRGCSLLPWQQPIVIHPSNCWIGLPHKLRTPSTCCGLHALIPSKSAYKILNGPYNWNRYPLAPLGCKAVVYKDGNTQGSWASHGIDAFYLGPAKDHYRCNNYYILNTRLTLSPDPRNCFRNIASCHP